jgi:superfamily I DNA/RNA helicase
MPETMVLDEEQQEVIDYKDSCLVVAGPGSGKTRTLVAKAESLWLDKDIICLTFTRAAAREMRQRMPGVKAKTIHSYCYGEVGWPGNYDKLLPKFLVKDEKEKYEYVLVDEVQDLTEEELSVVLSIVGDKIFAVGDPYQSIYGWNGALGMDVFRRLNGHKTFNLHNNYRSCPQIVEWLNRVYGRQLVSKGIVENGLTAILCRTNRAVWEVTQLLEEAGIGFTVRIGSNESRPTVEEDYGDDKLKVMTCHCSKGLEFDRVLLYNWMPEPFWGEEKNLYYVAMARASKEYCEVNGHNLVSTLRR